MAVIVKSLYGTVAGRAAQTAGLPRERRFDEIDIENGANAECPFAPAEPLDGDTALLPF